MTRAAGAWEMHQKGARIWCSTFTQKMCGQTKIFVESVGSFMAARVTAASPNTLCEIIAAMLLRALALSTGAGNKTLKGYPHGTGEKQKDFFRERRGPEMEIRTFVAG